MPLTKKFFLLSILAFSYLFFSPGCAKNNSYISKMALKKKIVGTWHMVQFFPWDRVEDWEFTPGGSVIRYEVDSARIFDQGTYFVSARIFNSKLNINGFTDDAYNGKWFIVNISSGRLQINTAYRNCPDGRDHCGTFEREFYKD